ncbi:MAG: NAD(P)H-dependent oxidoreductase subunit E [Firmicutes bacterium]|nr:NAD(P)H-dependent oxidoreductase subunit E [Bacillota bacterium]
MPQQYPEVDAILEAHGLSQSAIISILQDVQKHYRYLPQDVLVYVAKRLGVSEAKVYSVATFYDNFSLEPKGKYVIKVCDGTACHVRKSPLILNAVNRILGLNSEKHTTDDMLFSVETVSCLGTCGLAPVLTVNDKVYPSMTPEKTEELLKQLKEEAQ